VLPVGDSEIPLWKHLEQAAKTKKCDPEDLYPRQAKVSPLISYLWDDYSEIAKGREQGMGVCRISHREIQAYEHLYGIEFEPWEIEILREIDDVYVEVCSDRLSKIRAQS
jgi:hypothetical protein